MTSVLCYICFYRINLTLHDLRFIPYPLLSYKSHAARPTFYTISAFIRQISLCPTHVFCHIYFYHINLTLHDLRFIPYPLLSYKSHAAKPMFYTISAFIVQISRCTTYVLYHIRFYRTNLTLQNLCFIPYPLLSYKSHAARPTFYPICAFNNAQKLFNEKISSQLVFYFSVLFSFIVIHILCSLLGKAHL